jgi:hypothetical protein
MLPRFHISPLVLFKSTRSPYSLEKEDPPSVMRAWAWPPAAYPTPGLICTKVGSRRAATGACPNQNQQQERPAIQPCADTILSLTATLNHRAMPAKSTCCAAVLIFSGPP